MISTTQGEPASKHLPIDEPPDSWTEPAAVLSGLISMHLDQEDVFRVPRALAELIPGWAERAGLHGTKVELAELGTRYKLSCPEPIVLDLLRRYYTDRRRS